MSPTRTRALHVLMAGFDRTVFEARAPSDTWRRLVSYAAELERLSPDGQLTYLALGAREPHHRLVERSLEVIAVPGGRARRPVKLYRALRSVHQLRPIDVITTETPAEDGVSALLFGRTRQIPVVAQVHDDVLSDATLRTTPGRAIARRIRQGLIRHSIRHYAAVRTVSTEIAGDLHGCGARAVFVIPVPIGQQALPQTRRETGRSVLYVGRLVEQKRLDRWLEVAARIAEKRPDVRFELVGDGPLRGDLEEQADALGLSGRCNFRGQIPHDELGPIYAEAWVLLLTSDHEGFGRVLVEAARAGTPSVSTDIRGPRDIIDDGLTGYLRPPGDTTGLADAVIRLLEDADLRANMGGTARLHAERFEPSVLTAEWIKLLVDVAEAYR